MNTSSNSDLSSQVIFQGNSLDERLIGPGLPPKVWVFNANQPNLSSATTSLVSRSEVPALYWSYGCSATSATMLFGYYDRKGYSNLYTGSTNNGVFPLNNSVWGKSTENYGRCPLTASQKGLDGRTTRGHVDDYYSSYGSSIDPYYNNWVQHSTNDCIADFMGTNMYKKYSNTDGGTRFYYYTNGSPLNDFTGFEGTYRDGMHGMRLFAESKGYYVDKNYNQYISGYNGNAQGFTYSQYKSEIDAGYPVLIQVSGHTMLGVGYTGTNQIIVRDTWDYSDHTMTWGGTYAGLQHYGVGVIHLKALTTSPTISSISPSIGYNTTNTTITIAGSNFRSGANIIISKGTLSKKGTISNLTSTSISCSIPTKGSPVGVYNVTITNTDSTSYAKVNAFTISSSFASIHGIVTDSVKGNPISGATISIGGKSTTSNSTGGYFITGLTPGILKADFTGTPLSGSAPLSVYFTDLSQNNALTLNSTKTGYITYTNPYISISSNQDLRCDIPLTPIGSANQYRIVLTWGATPLDLDSHLKTPKINGNSYHVWYSSKGNLNSGPFAALDLDDTTSYGPETITINKTFDGTYCYFVHDYSDRGGLGKINTSSAMVNVYKGSSLIATFNAPSYASGTGTYWQVFNLSGSTITPVNRITTSSQLGTNYQEYQSDSKNISSTKLEIVNPPLVLFDSSTDPIISWLWNFGDGTTSTSQNPSHTFSTPGYKSITLTVKTANSQSVISKQNFVYISGSIIGAAPKIISITPTIGYPSVNLPLSISGTDFRAGASVILNNSTVTKMGAISNLSSTKIICSIPIDGLSPGVYTLIVRNSDNTQASISRDLAQILM